MITRMKETGTEPELETLRAAFEGRELGLPIGWPAVQAFEEAEGVTLPEPYRSFVALVGNGCRSGPPRYGLLPLVNDEDCHWAGASPGRLARPFPLRRTWIWEDDQPPPAPGVTLDMVSNGILLLGHDGCGMYWMLVVTGEHRGQVWNIADVGAQPFGRSFGYTTAGEGFAGWIAHWASGREWFDAKP